MLEIEIGQVVSQMIAFLIMLWVLKKFAWKPILGLLDERKKIIQDAFDSIDKQRKEVDEQAAAYDEKLRGIDAEARAKFQTEVSKGAKVARKLEQDAHDRAHGIVAHAQEDAVREVELAKIRLRKDIVNLVIASTQKLIQTELKDKEKQKKLVESILDQAELK